jgi:hypothetical protein
MNITKVTQIITSQESDDIKSLVILYDNGVQFSFPDTDEDKLKNEGEWDEIQAWVAKGNTIIVPDTSLTWDDIRATRDKILRDTDWTMTSGATVDQAQWAAYRQVIRDIPQTYKDKTPDDVIWPTQPSTAGPNT